MAAQTRRRSPSSMSTIGSLTTIPLPNVTTRTPGSSRVSMTKPGTSRVWRAPMSRIASQTASGLADVTISLRIDAISLASGYRLNAPPRSWVSQGESAFSIEARYQTPRAAAIGIVLAAEMRAQQSLLRTDARHQRHEHGRYDQQPDSGAKGECPSDHVDQEPEITWMADHTIGAARFQGVSRLDGYQATEPWTQHKDGPDPQGTTDCVEDDPDRANRIAVKGQKIIPVGIGWQIGEQQAEDREGYNDPAIGAILAFARAEIAVGEYRHARHGERHDGESNERRPSEKGLEPAPAENGKPKIEQRAREPREYQSRSDGHWPGARSC